MKQYFLFSAKNQPLISQFLASFFVVCFFVCFCASSLTAQDEPPADVAPPPIKVLSAAEKKVLDNESSLKKRTKVALELMDARLELADKEAAAENFKQSLEHLASFQALMDYVFNTLTSHDIKNKADGRFKQFEIYLRRQTPRIEIIRRQMPYRYGYYVIKIMKSVRETRAKAVEPLFGEAV